MRCVAIGLSNTRSTRRDAGCVRTDLQATRSHVVKQRRDGFSWTQPVETPEP